MIENKSRRKNIKDFRIGESFYKKYENKYF